MGATTNLFIQAHCANNARALEEVIAHAHSQSPLGTVDKTEAEIAQNQVSQCNTRIRAKTPHKSFFALLRKHWVILKTFRFRRFLCNRKHFHGQ